ncbi:hypothetical protein LXA43DRAFT_196929 [Ganoderma leucocontextum]|nr:hypothetical protein LXA43DRAFT_196929 [Ganoderma leucocontextum]
MSGLIITSLPPFTDNWNDMDHNVTIRPPKRPAPANYSDRAQARMIRQKLIEQEQEIEDREALKITPEELRILRDSFSSVKAEFTDLDGLSWDTPIARQVLLNWHAQQAARASLRSELDFGDLAHRMRRAGHTPSPRRSLASIICPPGLSASAPDLSELSTSTIRPEDDLSDSTATVRAPRDSQHESRALGDVHPSAFEMTIRVRAQAVVPSTPATSPASLSLGISMDSENERTPLPALFKSVPRECADVGLHASASSPQCRRRARDPRPHPVCASPVLRRCLTRTLHRASRSPATDLASVAAPPTPHTRRTCSRRASGR